MPTSSPKMKTRSSFSISSQMPSLMASMYVVTAMGSLSFVVDVFGDFFRRRVGLLLGPVPRVVDDERAFLLHLVNARLRQGAFVQQGALEARNRILALPFVEQLGGHVAGVVVRRVFRPAAGLVLHDGRSAAGAREVDGALGGVVHREDV